MKPKAFKIFCEEVRSASSASPVWRFSEYWNDLRGKQGAVMAAILDIKPEVLKIDRNGEKVYQFPTGREWANER